LKIENFTFQIGRAALPGNLPIFNFHFSIFNSLPLVAATRSRCALCVLCSENTARCTSAHLVQLGVFIVSG
jgi:hypothetical protein